VPSFSCDATVGSTDRLASLYFKRPANFQPNITFGMVAGQCPGAAKTDTCFNNTNFPLNDPNDPWASEAVQWLSNLTFAPSFATVRVNHFSGNSSLYTTLEMGFSTTSAGSLAVSGAYGPYRGFQIQYQTISAAPYVSGLTALAGALAIAMLG